MCFDLLYKFETFHILRGNELDVIRNMYLCSSKVPVILIRVWWKFNFIDRFFKNTQISNFVTISPLEAKLFNEDGRTDG